MKKEYFSTLQIMIAEAQKLLEDFDDKINEIQLVSEEMGDPEFEFLANADQGYTKNIDRLDEMLADYAIGIDQVAKITVDEFSRE